MTPLVCLFASLLAAPSDTNPEGTSPTADVELFIPIDAVLLATLEAGGDVMGEIPPTARRVSQYRLRLAGDIQGASPAANNDNHSTAPGSNPTDALELLIPVDAALLARLSGGGEVIGAIPTAAHDASRYRLRLTGASTQGASFARSSSTSSSSTGDHVFSVTPAAGSYAASSDLLLPGPERTSPQPPVMIEPPRMNELAPIVTSATGLVTNTLAAAKSILQLPPPPSAAATLPSTRPTIPHVAGLLSLPPPPGAPAYSTNTHNAPRYNVAPHYNVGNHRMANLTPVPSAPAPAADNPVPARNVTPVKKPVAVANAGTAATGLAAPDSDIPGADVAAPGNEAVDLADAAKGETDESRPWAALSFSLLGLFISIGGNCFLGWIAWDHRGRYFGLLRKLRHEKARA